MATVEMIGISKRFGPTVALDKVDLFLEAGEVHAILGENGSGKSTLMGVLAGSVSPDAGVMSLNGSRYQPSGPLDARKKGVAMIYQELALCPDLTVSENVFLGAEESWIGAGNMRGRAAKALAELGHPDIDVNARVRGLSISQRQIVEIARAITSKAQVIVLDEPTSSLTEPDIVRLFDVIRALRSRGHTIVYISHFLNEISSIADRVTVLRDGNLVSTQFEGDLSDSELITLMVGRSVDEAYPRSEHQAGDVLLEVEALSGRKKPLDTSLVLRRGEVVGVAGLNASGRTELIRCVFGLDKVKKGAIRLGHIPAPTTPQKLWPAGVGMLSEDRKDEGLALDLTISDNLTLTKLDPFVSQRHMADQCAELITRAGIKCRDSQQRVGQLSGGNQQKVAFARLLLHGVDLLLLDEPTKGIDVGSKHQLYKLIDELALEGKAVLLVSSYLPELLGICDRIAVMHKGQLGPAMPRAEVSQETLMHMATGA